MRNARFLLLLLLVGVVVISCDTTAPPTLPPPATAGGGFIIESLAAYFQGSPAITTPDVQIGAAWQSDQFGAEGNAAPFTVFTNDLGLASELSARAPAIWKFTWLSSAAAPEGCDGLSTTFGVPLDAIAEVICHVYAIPDTVSAAVSGFALSPDPVYISAAPASGTVQGQGITATYGMPLVQYYSLDGTLVAQENAISVASNGTSMQISGFSISQLPVGTYAAFVSNAASGGGYAYLGNGAVQVANGGVNIDGIEQSKQNCLKPARSGCLEWGPTIYDSGTVSITINGVTSSVSYGEYSTTWTLAVALANAINSNNSINSLVHAVPDAYAVLLDIQSGSGYSLSATATSNDTLDFPNGSFSPVASSSVF